MYLRKVYPILLLRATIYFLVVTCCICCSMFLWCNGEDDILWAFFWNLLVIFTFSSLFLWHFYCLLCSICAIITIVWKELPTSSHLHQSNVEIEEAIVMLTLKAEKRNPVSYTEATHTSHRRSCTAKGSFQSSGHWWSARIRLAATADNAEDNHAADCRTQTAPSPESAISVAK